MSYPTPEAIEYHQKRLARIIASHDKMHRLLDEGRNSEAAKIGRSFYANDKAKKWRMYESASWLRTHVSGQSGPLKSVEDCRVALNRSKLITFAAQVSA
jgi:hypothetical protein